MEFGPDGLAGVLLRRSIAKGVSAPVLLRAWSPTDRHARDRSCLDYILRKLSVSPLFPPPRPTRNVLTTEFDLLTERHRKNVEYLVTGGQGRSFGMEEQVRDADERRKPVEQAFQGT